MPNKQPRIPVPKNVGEKIALAKKIFQKHQADGAASPLNSLTDFNWTAIGPNLQPALDLHEKAEYHRRLAEAAYRERDLLLGDIEGAISSSRDVLKGVHKKNPKRLGEWGFTVDDTTKATPASTGS